MTLGLVLTNDWEIFGDGSGDYFELQHKPLENLLNLLDGVGGKVTIMAEVGQQIGYKSISASDSKAKEITDAWESIVKDSVKRGSDVQLHFHPQWAGARFENGVWNLNMSNWALPSLSSEQILEFLTSGKKYLEELIKPEDPNYRCIAFRAGAHCIQPGESIIKALKTAGILCDTSVLPGMAAESFYDFTNAASNIIPWFTSENNVKDSGLDKGLLELPIYTTKGWNSEALRKYFPKLYFSLRLNAKISQTELDWQFEREKVKNIRYPRSQRYYKQKENHNLSWYMSKIISGEPVKLDYDFLPATAFVKMLKSIYKEKAVIDFLDKDIVLPVVAIGHLKDTHNLDNIARIHDLISKEMKQNVRFITLSQAISTSNTEFNK